MTRALETRLSQLDAGARDLLQIVATAGRPLPASVALRASGQGSAGRGMVQALMAARLLKPISAPGADLIEIQHDQIRAAVEETLSGESLQRCHARLLSAHEAAGESDAVVLVRHVAGAGQSLRARTMAVRYAERAVEGLAFEQAASLFGLAAVHAQDDDERRGLLVRQGRAYRDSSHCMKAGEAFLEAAALAAGQEREALEREAAQQLIMAGELDRALDLFQSTLDRFGLTMPGSEEEAVLQGVSALRELLATGVDWPDPSAEAADEHSEQADVLWAMAWGLFLISMRTLPFAVASLQHALQAQDRRRATRALYVVVAIANAIGLPEAQPLNARVQELAVTQSHEEQPWLLSCEGQMLLDVGRVVEANERFESATALWLEERRWSRELSVMAVGLGMHCSQLSAVTELRRFLPTALDEAARHAHSFALRFLQSISIVLSLADDDVDAARGVRDDAFEAIHFSSDVLDACIWSCSAQLALYSRDPGLLEEVHAGSASILSGSISYMRNAGSAMRWVHAMLCLARAEERGDTADLEHTTAELRLIPANLPFFRPIVESLRAGVSFLRGNEREASMLLQRSIESRDPINYNKLHHACTLWHAGQLVGGATGRTLGDDARRIFDAEQVANPEGWMNLLTPGFRGLASRIRE